MRIPQHPSPHRILSLSRITRSTGIAENLPYCDEAWLKYLRELIALKVTVEPRRETFVFDSSPYAMVTERTGTIEEKILEIIVRSHELVAVNLFDIVLGSPECYS